MIYFDNVRLVASTLEEMHQWAKINGLPKKYFTDHPHYPHYIHVCAPNKPEFTGTLLRMASPWKKKPTKNSAGIPKVPTAKKVSSAELLTRSHFLTIEGINMR